MVDFYKYLSKIITTKRVCYTKKYYLCTANTRYWLTQIINPLKTFKNGNKNQTTEKRS